MAKKQLTEEYRVKFWHRNNTTGFFEQDSKSIWYADKNISEQQLDQDFEKLLNSYQNVTIVSIAYYG